jgi:hypothetical protein
MSFLQPDQKRSRRAVSGGTRFSVVNRDAAKRSTVDSAFVARHFPADATDLRSGLRCPSGIMDLRLEQLSRRKDQGFLSMIYCSGNMHFIKISIEKGFRRPVALRHALMTEQRVRADQICDNSGPERITAP